MDGCCLFFFSFSEGEEVIWVIINKHAKLRSGKIGTERKGLGRQDGNIWLGYNMERHLERLDLLYLCRNTKEIGKILVQNIMLFFPLLECLLTPLFCLLAEIKVVKVLGRAHIPYKMLLYLNKWKLASLLFLIHSKASRLKHVKYSSLDPLSWEWPDSHPVLTHSTILGLHSSKELLLKIK